MSKVAVRLAMLALVVSASSAMAAPSCESIEHYKVQSLSFNNASIASVVSQIAANTPYQIKIAGNSGAHVSATNVSGSVNSLLDNLGKKARFSWFTDPQKCVVSVLFDSETNTTERTKASAANVGGRTQEFKIQLGDVYVSRALARWGQEAGWRVIWDAPNDFPVAAEAQIRGTFREAIGNVMTSLAKTDFPVSAVFYQNNVVRIVRYEGQSNELSK